MTYDMAYDIIDIQSLTFEVAVGQQKSLWILIRVNLLDVFG